MIFEYSKTYLLLRSDSPGGFPSPYISDWGKLNKTTCFDTASNSYCVKTCDSCTKTCDPNLDPLKQLVRMQDNRKIIYNKEYDNCVVNNAGNAFGECPPGPFYCEETREITGAENIKLGIPNIDTSGTTQGHLNKMSRSWASCPHTVEDCKPSFETHLATLCEHNQVFTARKFSKISRTNSTSVGGGTNSTNTNTTNRVDVTKMEVFLYLRRKTANLVKVHFRMFSHFDIIQLQNVNCK